MPAVLALFSAMLFALAAALQQRGQFRLAGQGVAVGGLAGLVRLLAVPVWLFGTVVMLAGFATQGLALDDGRLVVIQPLMVTTIVWALPLGHWLTHQTVVRMQVLGAAVVVVGLTLFVLVGDPDAGVSDASTRSLVIAAVSVCAIAAVLVLWLRRGGGSLSVRAAVLGVCSGLFFALAAMFAIPVMHDLEVGFRTAAGDWRTWALIAFGLSGFLIQQLSLATGQLAPALVAVSVTNPAVSVLLGIVLYQERLTRPAWHVLVAVAALVVAFAGAALITWSNRETQMPGRAGSTADARRSSRADRLDTADPR
jgi:drug/metabolite transporter (DMT)-like permease